MLYCIYYEDRIAKTGASPRASAVVILLDLLAKAAVF